MGAAGDRGGILRAVLFRRRYDVRGWPQRCIETSRFNDEATIYAIAFIPRKKKIFPGCGQIRLESVFGCKLYAISKLLTVYGKPAREYSGRAAVVIESLPRDINIAARYRD